MSCSCSTRSRWQTVEAALDAARAAGAVTVLNTAPFRAEAAACLGKADYVVANETEFDLYGEALALRGRDRPARMRDFAGKTGRTIVVTLGGDGVLAATPSRSSDGSGAERSRRSIRSAPATRFAAISPPGCHPACRSSRRSPVLRPLARSLA